MPTKILKIDVLDVIEARNFAKWAQREAAIFRNDPALQEDIVDNIEKVTNLPIKEIMRMRRNGY